MIKCENYSDMKNWEDKICNPSQMGGIETSVLDNGAGRGVRIAWINTGSGLRYKVVIDRGLDISEAFFNQHGLAWVSRAGIRPPEHSAMVGLEWLRNWGGGLVTTCGISYMGSPETDEYGERGLHGRISNIPAEVFSIQQPDPQNGQMDFSITGVIHESGVFGPHLDLQRTISGTLGVPEIRISDRVTNRGNAPAPHMLLYHCNMGWPLIDAGTQLNWKGNWESRGSDLDNEIFHLGGDFRTCREPMESHRNGGEACAFIDIEPDQSGYCHCSAFNPGLGTGLEIRFRKEQLPWLINWQHWGKGEYVTALEPGTNLTVGQSDARKKGTLIILKPGESREYELRLAIITQPLSQ
jgi:galactose mutarotase-like enzyme